MTTVADQIAQVLAGIGVERIYGIVGFSRDAASRGDQRTDAPLRRQVYGDHRQSIGRCP
jgi:hypothetical protein